MKKLILLRGPSGTGKTTISTHLLKKHTGDIPTGVRLEADAFHTKSDGSYHFDLERLNKAHQWCQLNTEFHMFRETELIIVSNTSTTKREAMVYLDLADRFGYEVEVIRTPDPWDPETLFRRNKHNVPMDVINKQIARYTPLDLHNEEPWSDMSIFEV